MLRATKTHRTYCVAVDHANIQRLVDHYQRSTQRATQHEHLLTDKAFVFSAEPDGSVPWLPNRVTKMFINHRRRAGVGQFRLHDLRHFMATEMLAHGVAIVTVSQRLGHARASTTLNVYGHCHTRRRSRCRRLHRRTPQQQMTTPPVLGGAGSRR